jgi:hypothetical protein
VATDPVQELFFGPATISVHNDSDMTGQLFSIDLFHHWGIPIGVLNP